MTSSLKSKLILTYLVVSLLTVLVVSALIRLTSGQSLMNLVVEGQTAALKTMAQDYYTTNGNWEGFFETYLQSAPPQLPPPESDPIQRPPSVGDERSPIEHNFRGLAGMVDTEYRAILPTLSYAVGQTIPQGLISRMVTVDVDVDGETVAWILPDTSFQFRLSAEEQVFLQRTNLAIGMAALAGVMVALITGIFFAARLLKPIRLLTEASRQMALGKLNQQVPVASKDELGQLTASFNQMSTDLDRADQQRKRMTADITHDLSTPIQIISGYMEMLEDGKAQLAPQRIDIIKTELEHLSRLVGDLSTLTQVEAGALEFHIENVQAQAILEQVFSTFQPIAEQEGVELALYGPEEEFVVQLDEGRMVQVLKNLLENALRHTPRGGQVNLGVSANEGVEFWVQDTGMGIDAEDLPYVFDRFYRADKARSTISGKMGLGLAICKALVEAQGGKIFAESRGRGLGTRISIKLYPCHN